MPEIQKFMIAPFSEGLDKELEPWLLPNEAFVDMQDAFLRRGVLQKRYGYEQLATGGEGSTVAVQSRIVTDILSDFTNDESRGSTDGAGAQTGQSLANTPVSVGSVIITVAGSPADVMTDNSDGTLTGNIGTGTVNYSTGAITITGSNATSAVTVDYRQGEALGTTDGAGALAAGTAFANIPVREGDVVVSVFDSGTPAVETFSDDGAGVLTGDVTGTGTVDYTTGVVTITGSYTTAPVIATSYSYYASLPVMGVFNYVDANNVRHLCALDTRNFNQYSSTTNRLDYVSHLSGTTYSGTDSDYWSATNYSVLDTSPPKFQRILVFTNGIDGVQYFDGTNTEDLDQHGDYDAPPTSIGGVLNTCKLVFYFNDRLCCLNVKQNGVWYPQRLLYSASVISAKALDFNDTRAGVIDAPTDDEIMGAELINNRLIVFFRDGVWALKFTTDRLYPFRWDRLDVKGIARCDARFSTVSYFNEVSAAGKLGIISSDGNSVARVDNKLPYFTRDEIDPELFKYCYSVESERNRQRWMSYVSPDNSATSADRILVNGIEDNSWSIYTIAMHCFGNYHEIKFDKLWDELDDPWDSNGNPWDEYTEFKDALSVIGGDIDGYVFKMDTEDNDDRTSITGISQAAPAVVTVLNHRLTTGDVVKIYDTGGMTEIIGLQSKVTVVNATSFQLNEIDSTDFTAYTSGGVFEKAIPFDVKTKPLNPWIEEDSKATLHWVDFRVDSSPNTTCNIQFFTDEREQSYILPDQTSSTISLDFSDDSNRPIKWIRVYVNSTAYSHQVQLFQEKVDERLRIHAMRWAFSRAGTLESD